jgi:hypothetical protein
MRNKLVMDDRNSAEGMSQGPTSAHAKKMSEMRKKKAKKARQVGMKDGDFEKMFGENIDQFLEDSEWDVDSFDKMSHASKNSAQSAQNQMKLKAMEKVYLSRIETQNQGSNLRATQQNQSNSGFNPSGSAQRSSKKIPKVPSKKVHGRETQDRFTDDPDYIRRGQ